MTATYKHNNRDVIIPNWLINLVAQDPAATVDVLWEMRDHWPEDFIEALRPTEFSFSLDLRSSIALLDGIKDS